MSGMRMNYPKFQEGGADRGRNAKPNPAEDHRIEVLRVANVVALDIQNEFVAEPDDKILVTKLLERTEYVRTVRLLEISLMDPGPTGVRALERLDDMQNKGKLAQRAPNDEDLDEGAVNAITLDV